MKNDWIVINCNNSINELICMNCETRQAVPLPMPVDMWLAMNKAFIKLHKKCKRR